MCQFINPRYEMVDEAQRARGAAQELNGSRRLELAVQVLGG
jgi:hypothetical protein